MASLIFTLTYGEDISLKELELIIDGKVQKTTISKSIEFLFVKLFHRSLSL